MSKAGMILEGGGTRGVFTAGVLDYFMEQGLYLPYVIGVSAGACNAVDYVSRQPGRMKVCTIDFLEAGSYIGLKSLIRTHSLFNMDLIFDVFPNKLIPFDYDTYFSSGTTCILTATNCLTGKAAYLTENSDRQRLMAICRASSSLPIVSRMVDVDGVPMLDGGLADSIPVKRAQALGNEKIIVILTRNPGYRKKPTSRGVKSLYKRAYKKYPNLVRTAIKRSMIYNQQMELVEKLEDEGKIFVIRPLIPTVSRLEKNYDALMHFYEHGYRLMKRQYQALQEYMEK